MRIRYFDGHTIDLLPWKADVLRGVHPGDISGPFPRPVREQHFSTSDVQPVRGLLGLLAVTAVVSLAIGAWPGLPGRLAAVQEFSTR